MVLCARSEYFRRLFLSGMREATEEVTDLTGSGIPYQAFIGLLEFIYTDGLINITPDSAVDLLVLSHEYILGRLKVSICIITNVLNYFKTLCEKCMLYKAEIDIENCVEVRFLKEISIKFHL